jgi:hypothetical protein
MVRWLVLLLRILEIPGLHLDLIFSVILLKIFHEFSEFLQEWVREVA